MSHEVIINISREGSRRLDINYKDTEQLRQLLKVARVTHRARRVSGEQLPDEH
jgi:hypothetical protein